jgi:hypothetical protein
MPVVTKEKALELLTHEVQEKLSAGELLEVYNEVFPDDPYTAEEVEEDSWPLVEQLVDHINGGLEIDEVMDLWGLIFPRHRNVWYDDAEERIHYNEEPEVVPSEWRPVQSSCTPTCPSPPRRGLSGGDHRTSRILTGKGDATRS